MNNSPFELFAKVKFGLSNSVYTINSVLKYRGGYVYLIRDHTDCFSIATHEQLQPYLNIMVGDSVMWQNASYTVVAFSSDKLFVHLRGLREVVDVSDIELVPRATTYEIQNALRKVYGCNYRLSTQPNIGMGTVEMTYGQLIYDAIIVERKKNTIYKR